MATEVEHPMGFGASMSGQGSSPNSTVSGAALTPQSTIKQESSLEAADQDMLHGAMKPEMTPSPGKSEGKPGSAAKRPPRKSTLTQQQKNQKRQRATQDQLTTLEIEFNKCPTPSAPVRDRIAEQINMTERSVQIWFQNRRAKIKNLAKKSLETGEDIDSIPESMRNYLAMQAFETGKGIGGSFLGRGLSPFGAGNMLLGGGEGGPGKVLIQHLQCKSLRIGSWTRLYHTYMDLIVFYSPEKCTMTYYIHNDQSGYKIEYPFSFIKNIYLENNENDPSKEGGGIVIELNNFPYFFMDNTASNCGFSNCDDFTADQQATKCLVHHLGGNPKVLSGQLATLVSLDSFVNRHNPHAHHSFTAELQHEIQHPMSVSAPVSPQARPSSQPNFSQPQQATQAMFQEPWGGYHQMHSSMMRPHGHKRQRSRSVPGPVDFAMFQNQPMPSFYIQPPGEMGPPPGPPPTHTPLEAPIPQHVNNMGNNLRIDTQSGFGLEMRVYPMSATTASPAEFPQSPGYFNPGHTTPGPMSTGFNAGYGHGFLSPMVHAEHGMPTSVSPPPFPLNNEPSIVEQSPPMSMLGRPGSADLYHGQDGSCAVSDDGTGLDLYSKQPINLPMHPNSETYLSQQAELDMDQLVSFDTVDPSSLSPPDSKPHMQS